MIINLFSVFDPSSIWGMSLNWIVIFIIIILFPIKYFYIKGFSVKIVFIVNQYVNKIFNEVSFPNYLVLCYIRIIVFIYLIIINFIGLFPFVFTRTAHPIITIGLGVVIWNSFFLIGWFKNFKNRVAHLVPEGSPIILSPLIVIIERVSHLIRPFTLSIRLAANIIAGHLIIGLLARIRLINVYGFISSLIFQSILLILEFGVAIIQGFVFRILLLLYALEYY